MKTSQTLDTAIGSASNNINVLLEEQELNLVGELQQAMDSMHLNINAQLYCIVGLGEIYRIKGNNNIDRLGYCRSTALYNYAINFCKQQVRNGNNAYLININEYEKKLEILEKEFLENIHKGGIINPYNYQAVKDEHNSILQKMITESNEEINELGYLHEQHYKKITNNREEFYSEELKIAECTRNICKKIKSSIKKLMIKLVFECQEVIGLAPCKYYAFIGLGSLARSEMTPFSDLEWAILFSNKLIEESNTDTSFNENRMEVDSIELSDEAKENIKEYFRNLSIFLYLKIINLGKTILTTVSIKSLTNIKFYDGITPRGFTFDSLHSHACKWPLGRKNVYDKQNNKLQDFELIGTPEEIASYQIKNNYEPELHLAEVLMNAVFIMGEKNLVKLYRDITINNLNKKTDLEIKFCEMNGMRLLKNYIIEFPPVKFGKKHILFDVKKEIYRFPESILEGICLYNGIAVSNGWKKIEELRKRNIINLEAEKNLKVILSISVEIRLRTYLKFHCMREHVMVTQVFNEITQDQQISEVFNVPTQMLLRYFHTAIPLYNIIVQALSNHNIPNNILREDSLLDYSYEMQDLISYERLSSAIAPEIDVFVGREIEIIKLNKIFAFYDPKTNPSSNIDMFLESGSDKIKNIILVSAFGGTGKTTLAVQYGNIVKKAGYTVRWFEEGKIPNYYIKIAEEMGIITQDQEIYIIRKRVNAQLRIMGPMLFIFDNLDKSNFLEAKEYIEDLPENISLLITSRDPDLGQSHEKRFSSIELKEFTEEEANVYIEKYNKYASIKISPRNALKLINKVGTLPFRLSLALSALNDDVSMEIEDYILTFEQMKSDGNDHPEIEIVLGRLFNQKNQKNAGWKILQYLVYLDNNFIPLSLFKITNFVTAIEFSEGIKLLKSLSLISIVEHEDNRGFRLHEFIQKEVKTYATVHKDLSFTKETIILNLVQMLNEVFPEIQNKPDKKWEQSKLYASSVKSLLKNIDAENSMNIVSLMHKYSLYLIIVMNDYRNSIQYLNQALSLIEALDHDQEKLVMANILHTLGEAYYVKGEARKGLEYLERAALLLNENIYGYNDKKHHDLAKTLNKAGRVCCALGDAKKGFEYVNKALEINQLRGIEGKVDIADNLSNLGTASHYLGDFINTKKYFEDALEIYNELYLHEDHPSIARCLNNIGLAYDDIGNINKEIEFAENALNMRIRLYKNRDHPDIANSLNNMGLSYQNLRDLLKSKEYLEKSVEMKLRLYPNYNHLDVAWGLNNLGITYDKLENLIKAKECFEESLKMYEELYPNIDHPYVARCMSSLGRVYTKLGKLQIANNFLEDSFKLFKKIYENKNDAYFAYGLNNLGLFYEKLGELIKAVEYFEKSLKMYEALYFKKNHFDIVDNLYSLGLLYNKFGEEKSVIGQAYIQRAKNMEQELYNQHPNTKSDNTNMIRVVKDIEFTKNIFDYQAITSGTASNLEDQELIDKVALQTQREIKEIYVDNYYKTNCRVVPATPDGSCGFHAISETLKVQGRIDLAEQISREKFINSVTNAFREANDQELNDLISAMLQSDQINDINEWSKRFKSTSYWVEEAHLRVLSRLYNLKFKIYCLNDNSHSGAIFTSYPLFPEVNTSRKTEETPLVILAAVSTHLREGEAGTNHFDGIIVAPTSVQENEINILMQKVLKQIMNMNEKIFTENYRKDRNNFENIDMEDKIVQDVLGKHLGQTFLVSTEQDDSYVISTDQSYKVSNAVDPLLTPQKLEEDKSKLQAEEATNFDATSYIPELIVLKLGQVIHNNKLARKLISDHGQKLFYMAQKDLCKINNVGKKRAYEIQKIGKQYKKTKIDPNQIVNKDDDIFIDITIGAIFSIKYNNAVLNHKQLPEILQIAKEKGGAIVIMELMNLQSSEVFTLLKAEEVVDQIIEQNLFLNSEQGRNFIHGAANHFDKESVLKILELGRDQEIAEQILIEAEAQGAKRVIATLLGKELPVVGVTDNLENIIGTQELSQLQLVPNGVFNGWSNKAYHTVVEYIDNLAKNLDDLLNTGRSGSQVAVTVALLEEWLGFAASGQRFIGGRPPYYNSDDNDDWAYGSGGSSDGNNNSSAGSFDNQNGFAELILPAYNGTDYNITDYQM